MENKETLGNHPQGLQERAWTHQGSDLQPVNTMSCEKVTVARNLPLTTPRWEGFVGAI